MNSKTKQPAFIDLNAAMDSELLTLALRFLCAEQMDSLLGFALTFEQDCELVWMLHESGGDHWLKGHAITWDDAHCQWQVVSMSEAQCGFRGFYSCPPILSTSRRCLRNSLSIGVRRYGNISVLRLYLFGKRLNLSCCAVSAFTTVTA